METVPPGFSLGVVPVPPAGIRTQMPVQGSDLIGRRVYRFHHGGLDEVGQAGLEPARSDDHPFSRRACLPISTTGPCMSEVAGRVSCQRGTRPAHSSHRHHLIEVVAIAVDWTAWTAPGFDDT